MRYALALLAVTLWTALAAAQAAIDDGSFTLFVHGERIGREQFSIRRSDLTGRPALLVRATVTYDGRRIETTLRSDTAGQPMESLLEEYADGLVVAAARGDALTGRYYIRVSSPTGQAEREVRLLPHTILSNDETVHQYYFVARGAPESVVRVLVPRRLGQDSLTVSVRATDQPVDLGNGTVPARHLTVVDAAGVVTDVWVDGRGRLLRVAVESRGSWLGATNLRPDPT